MLFMPRSGDHFWQVPLKPTTMQYPSPPHTSPVHVSHSQTNVITHYLEGNNTEQVYSVQSQCQFRSHEPELNRAGTN